MGVHVIKTPDIGEGIAEVELVAWHVQAGDAVVADQILADLMTDKATVEVPLTGGGQGVGAGRKTRTTYRGRRRADTHRSAGRGQCGRGGRCERSSARRGGEARSACVGNADEIAGAGAIVSATGPGFGCACGKASG